MTRTDFYPTQLMQIAIFIGIQTLRKRAFGVPRSWHSRMSTTAHDLFSTATQDYLRHRFLKTAVESSELREARAGRTVCNVIAAR